MIATWRQSDLAPEVRRSSCKGQVCLLPAWTEPNAGSDAAALKNECTAEMVTTHLINGSKAFISVRVKLITCCHGTHRRKWAERHFGFVYPPMQTSYGRKGTKMGWNAQPTGTINLISIRIPANWRLGQGEGFSSPCRRWMAAGSQYHTCSLGTAQAALNQAHNYLQTKPVR